MEFKPTKSQELAIDTTDKNLLLSAAAGAGKTKTLTERIKKAITKKEKPADISRMLIVTYTRTAAAELRQKTTDAITEALVNDPTNEHLNNQALLIGSADICTIDSFCLDVVKSNFQRLTLSDGTPLPPDFRLGDQAEINDLRTSVMNDLIERWYSKPAGGLDFAAFAENFESVRDDGGITDILISFENSTLYYKNSETFAADVAKDLRMAAANREFFDSLSGKALKNHTRDILASFIEPLEDAIDYLKPIPTAENYLPAFRGDLKTVTDALAALDSGYAATRAVIQNYPDEDLTQLSKKDADEITKYYKSHRDKIRSKIREIRNTLYSFDEDTLFRYVELTAESAEVLGAFITDYRSSLLREKATRRIFDFQDIKLLAHKLLVNTDKTPSDIALTLRKKYTDVYIDEYQDVDPIQDDIFHAVAPENHLFMVGDIKQSIYSFRGSDPSIFGKYREDYPTLNGGKTGPGYSIFMSDNFRCNENIIKFSNLVSHATLAKAGGAIKYQPEDDLVFGKDWGNKLPVEVMCVRDLPRGSDLKFKVAKGEIRYIVQEIKHLLAGEKKDAKKPKEGEEKKKPENIKPEDIAILVQDSTFGQEVAKALSMAGIDSANSTEKDYFSKPEVLLLLSLLSAIDNPHNDVTLVAALRSPIFGFSMDELVRIKRGSKDACSFFDAIEAYKNDDDLAERCRKFEATLEALHRDSLTLPLDRLIQKLFASFSLTSLEMPGDTRTPAQIRDNILRFYEYAREFSETKNGDLSAFVKYLDNIIFSDLKIDSAVSIKVPGKVSILTIHKSKGLEFPVVFVCGCYSKFKRQDANQDLVYNHASGIGIKITDKKCLSSLGTPIHEAVSKSIMSYQNDEEMRLLYVALTRASERLYVTSKITKTDESKMANEQFLEKYVSRGSLISASNFLDMLLPVIAQENPCFNRSIRNSAEFPDPDEKKEENGKSNTDKETDKQKPEEKKADLKKLFKEKFEKEYGHEYSLAIPAKLSVSKLHPAILDADGSTDLNSGKIPSLVKKPLFLLEDSEKVEATAAERGTAAHLFLQFCKFEEIEKLGVEAELKRLKDANFFPEATAKLIEESLPSIKAFFKSALYASLKDAKKVYREQRFNLFLPATDFIPKNERKRRRELADEQLLVQGVIDLVFEDRDGKIILCDYKTDYLTKKELSSPALAKEKLTERYKNQLTYYADAVEKLFGKRPSRVCIYSLPLGDTVDIDLK